VAALVCARKLQQVRTARPEAARLRVGLERLGLASAASLAAGEEAIAAAVLPGLALPAITSPSVAAATRRRLLAFAFVADRRMQRILARPLAAPSSEPTTGYGGRRGESCSPDVIVRTSPDATAVLR